MGCPVQGLGGLCPPSQNSRGLGAAPPSQNFRCWAWLCCQAWVPIDLTNTTKRTTVTAIAKARMTVGMSVTMVSIIGTIFPESVSGGFSFNEVLDKITSPIRLHRSKNVSKHLSKIFRNFFEVFRKLFDCFVISKIFPEIGRAETIHLVRKSSNFEPSSRFFGRLKIWTSGRTSSEVEIEDVIFSNMPVI